MLDGRWETLKCTPDVGRRVPGVGCRVSEA